MLTNYLQAAMNTAHYEILPDDGSYYGEIPNFEGVYANTANLEDCRAELLEVLEDWLMFRLSRILLFPVVAGIELKFKEVA